MKKKERKIRYGLHVYIHTYIITYNFLQLEKNYMRIFRNIFTQLHIYILTKLNDIISALSLIAVVA